MLLSQKHMFFCNFSLRKCASLQLDMSAVSKRDKAKPQSPLAPPDASSSTPLLEPLKSPNRTPKLSATTPPAGGALPIAAIGGSAAPAPKQGNEFVNRTVYSLLMAYSFLAIIAAGADICVPLVLSILVMMFREVLRINQKERKDRQMPYFRLLPWWFLWVTVLVATAYNLQGPLQASFPVLRPLYHSFGLVAFSLYVGGLVAFVLSLKKGMYRYQFHQFTWMAMTLIFIVVQGSLQVTNMLYGMIWFLLPISCVVNNDIWAYGFGKSFGKTKLLALSPKKTVEGFLGAWLFTMIWGFWFAGFLSRFPAMTCPKVDFHSPLSCKQDPLFVSEVIALPPIIGTLTFGYWSSISVCPAQYHGIALAVFASLIAPFGGFFASGLKRAFKLKDFGDLIPGHGGMTDRMDCQIIMGMFTSVYIRSVVFSEQTCPNMSAIFECALALPVDQRLRLAKLLSGA